MTQTGHVPFSGINVSCNYLPGKMTEWQIYTVKWAEWQTSIVTLNSYQTLIYMIKRKQVIFHNYHTSSKIQCTMKFLINHI